MSGHPASIGVVSDEWEHTSRPIRAVGVAADAEIDPQSWPANVPSIKAFLDGARAGGEFGGWEFGEGVTFFVGENGSGKSTLIEGIAEAAGLPAEGGGSQWGGGVTHRSESPLGEWLRIRRGLAANSNGFFLRAETMHNFYTWRANLPRGGDQHGLHKRSHGESFNALLETMLNPAARQPGIVLLDEPEAALSFDSTLKWLANLDEMRARGTQIICATHSPILASLPGATILELGEWGIRQVEWEDLDLVRSHRSYLEAPQRYLRHLLGS